jgi:hypothetical protein
MAANITLPTTRRALSGHGYGLDRTSRRFTCAYARSCRPWQAMAGPACCRRQRDAPNTTDVAAPQQLAGRQCCHCCDNHRQARLQGGARARSTRQALYLCTLLKRTLASVLQPALSDPPTAHHSPRTTHYSLPTPLPTPHCPPLTARLLPTLAFSRPSTAARNLDAACPACPAWSSDGSHGSALTATPAAPPQPNPLAAASRLSGRCYVPPCTIRWPTTPACSCLPSSPLHCPHTSQEHGLLKHPMPMRAIS